MTHDEELELSPMSELLASPLIDPHYFGVVQGWHEETDVVRATPGISRVDNSFEVGCLLNFDVVTNQSHSWAPFPSTVSASEEREALELVKNYEHYRNTANRHRHTRHSSFGGGRGEGVGEEGLFEE